MLEGIIRSAKAKLLYFAFVAICISVSNVASISVDFGGSDSGESVSLSEDYETSTGTSIDETNTLEYGGITLTQSRDAKLEGENKLNQGVFGNNYQVNNNINNKGSLQTSGSLTATGKALDLSQNIAGNGDANVQLSGKQGQDSATQESGIKEGSLSSSSSISTGNSVYISQTTGLQGKNGFVKGSASNEGNIATTSVDVQGSLSSTLNTVANGYVENRQLLNAEGSYINANAYAKEGGISTQFNAKVQDEGRPPFEKVSGSLYSEAGSPQTAIGDLTLQGDKVTLGTTSSNSLGTYSSGQTKIDVADPLHKVQSSVATEGYVENSWQDEGKGKIEPINQVIDVSTPESNKKITNTVEGEGSYQIDGSSMITADGASFLQNIKSEGSIQDNIEIESHSEPLMARGYTYASKALFGYKSADVKKGANSRVFMSQNYLATGDVKQSAEAETIDGHSLTSVVIDDESIFNLATANLATTALASYNIVGSETYRRTRVTQEVTQATFIPASSVVSGAFSEYGGAQNGGLSNDKDVKSATAVNSIKNAANYDLSLSAETVKSAVAEQEIKTTGGDIKARTFSMDSDLRGAAQLIKQAYPEMASILPRYGLLRTLIIKGGYGPNTGVTADTDAAFWKKILDQEGFETEVKNWNDLTSDANIDEYLKSRNLIIFTAGGYWYSVDQDIDKLKQIHDLKIPLIFVAPDINWDWNSYPNVVPSFAKNVLHIDGALGIMPNENYDVYPVWNPITNPITNGLPNSITIPAVNSYPDSFKPYNGGQGVLSQGYMYSEFGVGSLANQASGSHYVPNPKTYAIVAYPGSSTEGRSVLFGFVPAGLQSDIGTKLAQNTVDWAANLPINIIPKSDISREFNGDNEKVQVHMNSHSYPKIQRDYDTTTNTWRYDHADEFASYASVGLKEKNKDAQLYRVRAIDGGNEIVDNAPARNGNNPADKTSWGIKEIYGNSNIQKTSGGRGVDVAIIDAGFDITHPDLIMRFEDIAEAINDKDITPGQSTIDDHGTHVAGILAADGSFDNNGIYGVAPDADLYSYTFSSSPQSKANLIYRAVDLGSEIISMSWWEDPWTGIDSAVQYAASNSVMMVKSAGNTGPDGTMTYPGGKKEIIAVGSLNKRPDGQLEVRRTSSVSSNWNGDDKIDEGEVELAAPGGAILSTFPTNNGWYDEDSGTSMAAPHISGLAAKLWSENMAQSPENVRNRLKNLAKSHDITLHSDAASGNDLQGPDRYTGFGFPHL